LTVNRGQSIPANRARDLIWLQTTRARLAAAKRDARALTEAIDAAQRDYAGTPGENDLERGWLLSEFGQAALAAGDRARALALFTQALTRLDPDSGGAHWAIAWAGFRQAGGGGDVERDARAQDMLQGEGVETPLARSYLRR
jgi:tetratricopeptide (TPR) repeat protein